MTRFLLLTALTLLVGCKTTSYCDFSLREDGWQPTDKVPQQVLQISSFDRFWYTNTEGEYLVCPKRSSEYVCGGFHMVYVPSPEGYRQGDAFVCMT